MDFKESFYFFMALLLGGQAGACELRDCVIANCSDDQACALEKTHLTRCEKCWSYVKEDFRLNRAYQELMRSLKQADQQLLRKAQRSWLIWREEKCEEVDVAANCENGACAGVAHDSCIVGLTRQRGSELIVFSQNLPEARKRNYAFTLDYDSLKYY
jgi:uncharacterized protein YecT (DUF1311 family)